MNHFYKFFICGELWLQCKNWSHFGASLNLWSYLFKAFKKVGCPFCISKTSLSYATLYRRNEILILFQIWKNYVDWSEICRTKKNVALLWIISRSGISCTRLECNLVHKTPVAVKAKMVNMIDDKAWFCYGFW